MHCHIALSLYFLWIVYVIFDGRSRLGLEYWRKTELFSTRFEMVNSNSLIAFSNWSVDDNSEWIKWNFSVSSLKDCQLLWFKDFEGKMRDPRICRFKIMGE